MGLVVEVSVLKRSIRAQDEGALSTRLGCRGAASYLSQTLRGFAGCCCLEQTVSASAALDSEQLPLTVSAGSFGYFLLHLMPVSKARSVVQTSIRTDT